MFGEGSEERIRGALVALAIWCGLAAFCWSARPPAVHAQTPSLPGETAPQRLALTRTASPLGSSRTLSFDIPLAPRQALRLHAGYDAFASFPEDENLEPFGRPTMKLRSVPLGADYVLHLADPGRRIVPVASAGVSLNLSRLSIVEAAGLPATAAATAAAVPFSALLAPTPEKDSRMGVGYDVHVALGLRARLNEHMFVLGQARLRHLDALGFSDNDLAEFDKLDFVVGVGFTL